MNEEAEILGKLFEVGIITGTFEKRGLTNEAKRTNDMKSSVHVRSIRGTMQLKTRVPGRCKRMALILTIIFVILILFFCSNSLYIHYRVLFLLSSHSLIFIHLEF